MKKKGGDGQGYSGPVTMKFEPPKPKNLTSEQLHQKLDECFYVVDYLSTPPMLR